MQLIDTLKQGFYDKFLHAPEFIIKAPGRVNLIGEHTDYNDGHVLPCAIEYAVWVAVSSRNDDLVNVIALDYECEHDVFSISVNIEHSNKGIWQNYVRGVIQELVIRGFSMTGCNVAIKGNIPQGTGLSSSAAIEVGVVYALSHLFGLNIPKKNIAEISQAAENNFVGCACGIMDQLASVCGVENKALAIDCRTLDITEVSIPEGITIMMIDSNVKRGLVDSEYNTRRLQCEAAANYFNVSHLRDVLPQIFEANKAKLNPIIAKRAEHVIYENRRTLDAVIALGNVDMITMSQLMTESHESMKSLFEITTPEIDYLVDLIADKLNGNGGARMTGGGFGGCVVALVPNNKVELVQSTIKDNYQDKTGLKAVIYTSRPVDGAKAIHLY